MKLPVEPTDAKRYPFDEAELRRRPVNSTPNLVDFQAIPEALRTKLEARGYKAIGGVLDIRPILAARQQRPPLNSTVILVPAAIFAGVIWPIAILFLDLPAIPLLLLSVCASWAVVLGLPALWRYIRNRMPNNINERDLEELRAAAITWPNGPSDLHGYPNAEVLTQEWKAADFHYRGDSAKVWREPKLVATAQAIAAEIRDNPLWDTDLLAGARPQLDQAMTDIEVRAHRIWRVHAETTDIPTNLKVRQAAERAWDVLRERVDLLDTYRRQLAAIEQLHRAYKLAVTEENNKPRRDDLTTQLYRDAGDTTHPPEVTEVSPLDAPIPTEALRQAVKTRIDSLETLLDIQTPSPATATGKRSTTVGDFIGKAAATATRASAEWIPITNLPSDPGRVVSVLLRNGALEITQRITPGPSPETLDVDDDPLLHGHDPEQVRLTMSVLWPRNKAHINPNDLMRQIQF
ncbi:Uncharacterised protein [Mycobacteroides abscessus subsp. abscessus]|uniref:hypothetical protein n=1 Tax=Mycobacteroides abscessus TaxID=36809 RepID=UPI000928F8F7|nr:hypothetical protein [Mycobacteroides abscessus]SHX99283.1 Uncharacterised protein [Mycobacteroides abscessus subsp. abscessus]SIC81237.1 Uncharacterised protein [Mycobacteroides abscessus subsp. abscessus]SKP25447.1 Uncharacterised protein [Mycobacteroides abscessus subsp. abscessus]